MYTYLFYYSVSGAQFDRLRSWTYLWLSFLGDIKTGTSFTFGYGPHSCIGKNFAMQEMKIVIVRLLQQFKFAIDAGNDEFIRKVRLTLVTIPNIKIRVQAL